MTNPYSTTGAFSPLAYVTGVDQFGLAGTISAANFMAANAAPALSQGGLPSNRQVSLYGDSRTANGVTINSTTNQFAGRALLSWARTLSRQAFDHNTSDVHGVTGYTSAQVLALLQTGLPTDTAGTIVVLCGTNDRTNSLNAAQSIANLTTIQNLVLSYGKVLIWLNEMPRGTPNALANPQLQYHLQVNSWFNTQSTVPGVYVADTFGGMVDPLDAVASPLASMMTDGLHPGAYGVYMGTVRSLLPIINLLFPPRNLLATNNTDQYDATNNLRGCLNPNPIMTGTTGTVNVPGAGTLTGNLATSYTADLTNGTGLTVTLSKVSTTSFNGVNYPSKAWQQIAVSGTPTSASPRVVIAFSASVSASIAAGDTIEQTIEYELDSGQTGILSMQMQAVMGGSITRRDMAFSVAASEIYPVDALAGVERIGPWVVQSAETTFYKGDFTTYFIQNVAASATIRIRAFGARKVV